MIGFIYIIRSHQTTDVYYGSTKQTLSQRMAHHRYDYKHYLEGKNKGLTSSIDILKFDDAYIELVEEVEYESRNELLAREGFHIRNNKCVNKVMLGRTDKEYREDTKAQRKEYLKQNKDKIKESEKKYHETNKEKIDEYKKQHYQDNKEHFKQYKKEWHLKKKALLNNQLVKSTE